MAYPSAESSARRWATKPSAPISQKTWIGSNQRLDNAGFARWLGPEQSESTRTPELLRALGIRYVCDWPNDDQPYEMDGHPGLISVPTTYGLDDAAVLWSKATPLETYERSVIEYFSGLAHEGEESGRTLVLVVRPWLTGQPFRIGSFEKVIDTIAASGQAWLTTTGEIASAYPASSFASSHSGD